MKIFNIIIWVLYPKIGWESFLDSKLSYKIQSKEEEFYGFYEEINRLEIIYSFLLLRIVSDPICTSS